MAGFYNYIIHLALMFVPGILWAKIDFTYGTRNIRRYKEFMLNSFLFASITQIAVVTVYIYIFHEEYQLINISETMNFDYINQIKDEIFYSILMSLFLSIIWLGIQKFRLVYRVLNTIGLTNRDGNDDVWSIIFSSGKQQFKFVRVIDSKLQMQYDGWVVGYSESEDQRELLLNQVDCYDFNYNFLHSSPCVYISRNKDDIKLEFPNLKGE